MEKCEIGLIRMEVDKNFRKPTETVACTTNIGGSWQAGLAPEG